MIRNCEIPFIDDRERSMRYYRNELLVQSDWTQTVDAPMTDDQKQAWATYRQALRDFPDTWTPGPTAEFPDPPNAGGDN